MHYADEGYLPEAMVNFLARLGWSHGDDEIFGRDQLVAWFDMAHVNPAPARFDADKLLWVNHEHLKRMSEAELGARLAPFLLRAGYDVEQGPPPAAVAALLRDRSRTLAEMTSAASYFYEPTPVVGESTTPEVDDAARPALLELEESFAVMPWQREAIAAAIKEAAARHGLKPPQVMMPLRYIVAGTASTPSLDAVLALLGRDKVRERMSAGLARGSAPT
jgi:glutamyl-tRNA synthetase